jgi:uncharacterized protein
VYASATYNEAISVLDNLVAQDKYQAAFYYLNNLSLANLSRGQQVQIMLRQSEIAVSIERIPAAQDLLAQIGTSKYITDNKENLILFNQLLASIDYKNNFYLRSAKRLIDISSLLDGQQLAKNQELIFNSLNRLSIHRLQKLRSKKNKYKPWINLAYIMVQYKYNLEQQRKQLARWQEKWEDHPLANKLPKSLSHLQDANQITHIALLLPFTAGTQLANLSSAIRSGFMAAYFASGSNIMVSFIDSSKYDGHIFDAIRLSAMKGAQLVIGPLQKKHIYALQSYPAPLPLPVLALNYGDIATIPIANNLLQFGLLPEDEVQYIAEQAWREGKKRVAILAINNNWGARLAQKFTDIWQELGGEIVLDKRFEKRGKYRKLIAQVSGIKLKDVRKFKKAQDYLPQYRQDIDFIFLASPATQAQQIKANLNFYLAADIPVYASSHVYANAHISGQNHDIENIYFPSMPWMFYSHKQLRTDLHQIIDNSNVQVERMYALGVDAFMLSNKLPTIAIDKPGYTMFGATGDLTIDKHGIVNSRLIWSKVHKGKLQAVVTPLQSKSQVYQYNRYLSK